MLAIRIGCRLSPLHAVWSLPRHQSTEVRVEDLDEKDTGTRMAYGFHPNTETLDAPKQALVLTKSLHFNQLPRGVSQGSVQLTQSLEPQFREAIVQAVGKDKRVLTRKYKEKPEKELNTGDFYFTLVMNLLRLGLAPLGPAQPVLTYKPYVAFEWKAFDTFSQTQQWMRVRGRPFGWLISSSKEMSPPLIESDPKEIQELSNFPLPELYPVSPFITLKQYRQRPSCAAGTHPGQERFRVPHTLVYLDDPKLQHKDNFQSMVFHLFSLLAAYATLHCGAEPDSDLDTPISCQGIQTSGRGYTFLYFQLNTLRLSDHEGVKNFLYTSDHKIPLYQFDLKSEKVLELDFQCLRLLVHTLNNSLAYNAL